MKLINSSGIVTDLIAAPLEPGMFGDGSDGDVTLNTGTGPSWVSGTGPYTLTRSVFARNLTLTGTGALNTAGFRIFCTGTLSIATFVSNNGGNGGGGGSGGTSGNVGLAAPAGDLGGSGAGDEATESLDLALAVEKAPEDAKLLFRMAEACFARGLLSDAKKWYSRRAELPGGKEETWYCLYQVAILTHSTPGATPEAVIQAYARAYDFLPSRLEPLAPLARIYRENGAHETAYQLSKLALGAVVPSKGLGFDPSIYELILPLEFVYACQALDREAEATLIALRLLEHPQLPADCRTRLEALSGVQGILFALPLGGSVSGGFLRSLCPGWWEHQSE